MTPRQREEYDEIDEELRVEYEKRRLEYERKQQQQVEELQKAAEIERKRKEQEAERLAGILSEQARAAAADDARSEDAQRESLAVLNEASRLNLVGRYSSSRAHMESYIRRVGSGADLISRDHWHALATATTWQARYMWIYGSIDEPLTMHEGERSELNSSRDLHPTLVNGSTPTQVALEYLDEVLRLIGRIEAIALAGPRINKKPDRTHLDEYRNGSATPSRPNTATSHAYTPNTPSAAAAANPSPFSPILPIVREASPPPLSPIAFNIADLGADEKEEAPAPGPLLQVKGHVESAPSPARPILSVHPPATPLHPALSNLGSGGGGAGRFAHLYTPRFDRNGMPGTPATPRTRAVQEAIAMTYPFIRRQTFDIDKITLWQRHIETEQEMMRRFSLLEDSNLFHHHFDRSCSTQSSSSRIDSTLRICVPILRYVSLDYVMMREAGDEKDSNRVEKSRIRLTHAMMRDGGIPDETTRGEDYTETQPIQQFLSPTHRPTPSAAEREMDAILTTTERAHRRILVPRSKVRLLYQLKMLTAITGRRIEFEVDFVEDPPRPADSTATAAAAAGSSPLTITRLHHVPPAGSLSLNTANTASTRTNARSLYASGPVLDEIQPREAFRQLIWEKLFRHEQVKKDEHHQANPIKTSAYDMMLLLWNDHGFQSFDDVDGGFGVSSSSVGVTGGVSSSLLVSKDTDPILSNSSLLTWLLPFQMSNAVSFDAITGESVRCHRHILAFGVEQLNREHSAATIVTSQLWKILTEWMGVDTNQIIHNRTLETDTNVVTLTPHPYTRMSHHASHSFDLVRSDRNASFRMRSLPGWLGDSSATSSHWARQLQVWLDTPLDRLYQSAQCAREAWQIYIGQPNLFARIHTLQRRLVEGQAGKNMELVAKQAELHKLCCESIAKNRHNTDALLLLARYALHVSGSPIDCLGYLDSSLPLRPECVNELSLRTDALLHMWVTQRGQTPTNDEQQLHTACNALKMAVEEVRRGRMSNTNLLRDMRSLHTPIVRTIRLLSHTLAQHVKLRRFLPSGWSKESLTAMVNENGELATTILARAVDMQMDLAMAHGFWTGRMARIQVLLARGEYTKALEMTSSSSTSTLPIGIALMQVRLLLHADRVSDAFTAVDTLVIQRGVSPRRVVSVLADFLHARMRSLSKDVLRDVVARGHALLERAPACEPQYAQCHTLTHAEAWIELLVHHERTRALGKWTRLWIETAHTPEKRIRIKVGRLLNKLFGISTDDITIPRVTPQPTPTSSSLAPRVGLISFGLSHLSLRGILRSADWWPNVRLVQLADLEAGSSGILSQIDVLVFPPCDTRHPDFARFYSSHARLAGLIHSFVSDAGGGFVGIGLASSILWTDNNLFGPLATELRISAAHSYGVLRSAHSVGSCVGRVLVSTLPSCVSLLNTGAGDRIEFQFEDGPIFTEVWNAARMRAAKERAEEEEIAHMQRQAGITIAPAHKTATPSKITLITPKNSKLASPPSIEVLARFTSDLSRPGAPRALMVGSPAILSARHGIGRILLASVMPIEGNDEWIRRAIQAVAPNRQ